MIAISDNRSSRSQAASISRPKGGAGSDEKISMTFIASRPFVFPPIPEVSAVPSHQTADGDGATFVEAYVTNGIGKANEVDEIDEDEVTREELSLSDEPLPEVSPTAILSRDLARVSGWSRNDDALDEESPDDVRTTLQKREFDVRIKSAVCLRKSAMVKTFLEMLAGLPQAPKSSFPSLRDSRKRQKAVFPCCGNPAKPKKHFFLVAGIPQSPKSTFSSLRKSREHQKVVFVRCGIPASISENILSARIL